MITIVFPISKQDCLTGLDFIDQWIQNKSYTVYGGGRDTLAGEGAGCADFATTLMSIVTGTKAPKEWFVDIEVPLKLIGDGEDRRIEFIQLISTFTWARKSEPSKSFRITDGNKVTDWIEKRTNKNSFLYTNHMNLNSGSIAKSVFTQMAFSTARTAIYTKGFSNLSYVYEDIDYDYYRILDSIKLDF